MAEGKKPPTPRVTETSPSWELGERLITGVVMTTVHRAGQAPGVWQRMLTALERGASQTREGTVDAFLFQAMVERLLAEYRGGQGLEDKT